MKNPAILYWFRASLLFISVIFINKGTSQNLIVNGDFSAGNTSFTTTDVYCNTSNCLFPYVNNAYAIGTNPNFYHSSFFGSDHTTGTGNMMIVNGGLISDIVWAQNVNVASNSTYSFSAWACSVYTANTAALGFSINGVSQGSLAAPATLNTWQPFSVTWPSGSATSASIVIRALNTSVPLSQSGVDFGLDDIALRRSNSEVTSIVSQSNPINTLKIYPNPTGNKLWIETNALCTVTLQDATGRKLEGNVFYGNGELEMSHYSAGIYFLVITSNDVSQCMKVIKTD